MTNLDAKVTALKKRTEEARKRRESAQAQATLASERVRQAEQALRDEFGLAPGDVAQAITQLEADLDAEVRRAEDALQRAEASE